MRSLKEDTNRGLDANNDGSITKIEALLQKLFKERDKNVKSGVSSVETSSVDKM